MKYLLRAALLVSSLCGYSETVPAQDDVYKDATAPLDSRVGSLLSQLTLEEKVSLCHGNFTSGGIPRLGIPPLKMLDGRQGLRPVDEQKGTRTTLLPCALSLSCTWDDDAATTFGKVLAEEMLALERHVLLAPMLNLIRSPLGGRNFENFGEDPYLVGRMGAAYINGVQQMGVGACSCLLVANDCERRRHQTSSNMNDRTLRELHLLGYEMSVRHANVWSMMSGNNLYNSVYCAENRFLIQDLIKDKFGFDGVMITDWRAAYTTTGSALAGTDMTTGFCSYVFGDGRLLEAVKSGAVSQELLEDKVRRILRLYIRCGVLDPQSRGKGGIDTPEHRAAARQLAAQGMVLLKNRGLLPLDTTKHRRILVTGPGADKVIQGGGSGSVPAAVNVSPVQGLKAALGTTADIIHMPFHAPLHPQAMEKGSIEWEQTTGTKPKGRRRQRNNTEQNKTSASANLKALTEAAEKADLVIFVAAGTVASEGRDLLNMDLPGMQAEAITQLTGANANVVVVLVNNGAISLEGWGDKAAALLAIHYSGEATGDALVDVLTGKVNPGGKLTYTFAKRLDDYACHALGEWPAKLILPHEPPNPGFKPEDRKPTHAYDAEYKEGVFSGYRWFDDKKIEPWYPFGFGLSYSTFKLSELQVANQDDAITVMCNVTNTGTREGAEVVQVYVAPSKSSVPRPPQELKGYSKVYLKPGESKTVEVELPANALAFYDESTGKWKAEAGVYEIRVGNSSRDLPLKTQLSQKTDRTY